MDAAERGKMNLLSKIRQWYDAEPKPVVLLTGRPAFQRELAMQTFERQIKENPDLVFDVLVESKHASWLLTKCNKMFLASTKRGQKPRKNHHTQETI